MATVKTKIGTEESARKQRVEPTGGITATNTQKALEGLDTSKVPATRTIGTTAPLAGGGDLSADRTHSITGAAGQVLAGAAPAFTATPTLGASGTLGSVTFGNATSGLLTLQAVTGALGTVTVSMPAANDTLVGKATTDVLTNKTYDTAGTGNVFKINGTTLSTLGATLTISGAALQTAAFTGDVTASANSFLTALTNIPSGITWAGWVDATPIAAPANPSNPKARIYIDNGQGNLVAKLSSGALSTTVIPDTGAANNFLTAISSGGVITKAQPSFTNLSGAATRAQGASDMVLLNTLTASASATLVDTTSITATYDLYQIEFENVVPVTNAQTLKMRVSQNGGSSYLAATYLDGTTNTDAIYITGGNVDNTAGIGVSGRVQFYGPNQTSNVKIARGSTALVTAGVATGSNIVGWYNGNNSAVNAIQFLFASGNISTGKIRIYGIKTS